MKSELGLSHTPKAVQEGGRGGGGGGGDATYIFIFFLVMSQVEENRGKENMLVALSFL